MKYSFCVLNNRKSIVRLTPSVNCLLHHICHHFRVVYYFILFFSGSKSIESFDTYEIIEDNSNSFSFLGKITNFVNNLLHVPLSMLQGILRLFTPIICIFRLFSTMFYIFTLPIRITFYVVTLPMRIFMGLFFKWGI